jgi:hypothetical protein
VPGGAFDEVDEAKQLGLPLQARTKARGGGKGNQPPTPQAPVAPQLPEFKDVKLGKTLGEGGNKITYEVPGREDIAIAVLQRGKSDSLDREVALLNELREQGLPTVEVLGKTTHNGQPALVMKKYAQGSKDIVRLDRTTGKIKLFGESKLLNEKSISDLQRIRSLMEQKKIKIDDLQFLIGKDGGVVVADPIDVFSGQKPSPNNLKMIDLLIESAQRNLRSN